MRLLIVVTHLLGAGHLKRAINLANAFAIAGIDTSDNSTATIISGGMPVDSFVGKTTNVSRNTNYILKQLPPLRSDGTNFRRLLTAENKPADTQYLRTRQDLLIEYANSSRCDVLITELFPFGRRVLRDEFIHLLEHITSSSEINRPLVLASVRDILAPPSSNKKIEQTDDLIERFYDGVLVHGDPSVIKLSDSWPVTERIAKKLIYTGFIQPTSSKAPLAFSQTKSPDATANDIVVSAGSGSVGSHIFETAIAAAAISPWQWRLLIGGGDASSEIARLEKLKASDNVIIEQNRPDFVELLDRCNCSVSMCGYNTAVELLITSTPGVLIPFDENGETEQQTRAQCMERMLGFKVVVRDDLTPQRLIKAVSKLLDENSDPDTSSNRRQLQFNGAEESFNLVTEMLSRKQQ